MTYFQALVMGIVQGLTEYLPVSSSAHLVLVPNFLNWNFDIKTAFIFDILVQMGTLVGVVIYFSKDLLIIMKSLLRSIISRDLRDDQHAKLGRLVILATCPAVITGLLFKDYFEFYFSSPKASCGFLIITGILLLASEYITRVSKITPTKKDALLIGCAQSLALFPGISRSGSTIVAGIILGLSRQSAARFSFLMSIPIMLGAGAVALGDFFQDIVLVQELGTCLVIGFLSAALSGYLVISWFMNFLAKRRLYGFACYCFILGIFGVIYFS